jgi:hypothetical protein
MLRLARGPAFGDHVAFTHVSTALDGDPPDVRQRRLVAVGGRDRDREAVRRHLAREGDLSRDRRPDRSRDAEGDVDAAVLTCGVLVAAERELAEDGSVGGPRPGESARWARENRDGKSEGAEKKRRCPWSEHGSRLARASTGCQRA